MSEEEDTLDADLRSAIEGFVRSEGEAGRGNPPSGLPPVRGITTLGPGFILGEYELIRRMASGGMGVVFEARQLSVGGRTVAVKVLRSVIRTERTVRRFEREIEAVARLDHRSIVPVLSSGVEQDMPFIAMKLIAGMPLHEVLRTASERHGAPPTTTHSIHRSISMQIADAGAGEKKSDESDRGDQWCDSYTRWVCQIGIDLASALQHAHEQGVIHRDVKPANIMVNQRGRAILLDFGLAVQEGAEKLTETGQFLGTLGYISPEQASGSSVDGRTDIWSLGAVLYELLSFRRPIEGVNRADLLRRLEREDPEDLASGTPRDLRIIISRALERDPNHRYRTADALARDLSSFIGNQPIQARPRSLSHRVRRSIHRHPWIAGVSVVGACLFGTMRIRDEVMAAGELRSARAALDGFESAAEGVFSHRETLAKLLSDSRARGSSQSQRIEQERRATDSARERAWSLLSSAEAQSLRAFDFVSDLSEARRTLARVYALGIEFSLGEYDDLCNRPRLDSLEERLLTVDGAGSHTRWLHRTGSVSIDVEPPDAHYVVFSDGDRREVVCGGVGSLRALALVEGSYSAHFEAEGRRAVDLPFRVRRRACYDNPSAMPPRELTLTLPMEGDVRPGYVHVPQGWTLVDEDPPRWEFVGDFQMKRDEVSFGELVLLMNVMGVDPAGGGLIPRSPFDPEKWLVRHSDGNWEVSHPGQTDLPARGLAPLDLRRFAAGFEEAGGGPSDGQWFTSLPTTSEWIRAARGADARVFPWGDEFEWSRCAAYPSTGRGIHEPNPVPVDAFPSDLSPFGVHALAGSVRELTSSYYGGAVDQFTIRGGSYRSVSRTETEIGGASGTLNVPHWDLGLRVVRKRIPAAFRPLSGSPEGFVDSFTDSGGEMGFWTPSIGEPLFETMAPSEDQGARIEDGELVLRSRMGNYASMGVFAYRPLRVGARDFRIVLRGRATHEQELSRRGIGLSIHESVLAGARRVGASLDTQGRLLLGTDAGTGVDSGIAEGEPFCLELSRRALRVEVRAWKTTAERPREPQLVHLLGSPILPTHVSLGVSSLIGGALFVTGLRLELLN